MRHVFLYSIASIVYVSCLIGLGHFLNDYLDAFGAGISWFLSATVLRQENRHFEQTLRVALVVSFHFIDEPPISKQTPFV